MLDTALAQVRFAASIVLGIPFSPRALDRIVDALRDTRQEFGALDAASAELLNPPPLDDATRRAMQLRRFRAQAARAARETAYYSRLFADRGGDPARLDYVDIAQLPLTPKAALRDDPDAFVRSSAQPALRAMTTGTTGQPTSVAFSARELHAITALAAIAFLANGQIGPADIVQISTSARATLGNLGLAGACARIGALTSLTGLAEPAHTLKLLAEQRRIAGKLPRASVVSTYPSYLGELVECGLRIGYRAADFGLARIFAGGELVTSGLRARCQELFGPVEIVETYAMTETIPFGGTRCAEGHLHFAPEHGLLEVLRLETGAPALSGQAGTIVATPFPPFRETTLLLRYDTQDVVRPIAGPLTCNLCHLPATTNLLGKLSHAVHHDDGWTFPREVQEALEAVAAVPLPARYSFWAVPGGVAVEVLVRRDEPSARQVISRRLADQGVPLRVLHLVEDRARLRRPIPLRCDLKEITFTVPELGGAASGIID